MASSLFLRITRFLTPLIIGITLVCGLLVYLRPAAAAPLETAVSGNITTSVTWTLSNSPYTVTGDILVSGPAFPVLTIEPGVEVRFTGNYEIKVSNFGSMQALGTPSQPITFTFDSSSPARGDWVGIIFEGFSYSSTIQYATIEYAKNGVDLNSLLGGVEFTVVSNTFRYIGQIPSDSAITGSPDDSNISYNKIFSSSGGIFIDESANNTIQGNEIYDIDNDCLNVDSTGATSTDNLILDNNIYNCSGRGIRINGGAGSGASGNQVISNTLSNISLAALSVFNQNGFDFLQNTVYSSALTSTATSAIILNNVDGADLSRNYIYSNGNSGSYLGALRIQNTLAGPFPLPLVITGTRIQDSNGSGFVFDGVNTFSTQTINSNAICVGGPYAIENNDSGLSLSAAGNWFGTNTPTSGSEITGTVTFAPFIQLAASANPLLVPADGTSAATISVSMNDGSGHTVPDIPSDGRDLSLTTNLGTLGASLLTLDSAGQTPGASLTSNSQGTATVSVTDWCGFTVQTTVQFTATDVSITKSAATSQMIPGETITYTLDYTNGSVTATNTVITDTLPSALSYVSASVSPSQTSPAIVWDLGNLAPGANGSITLVGRLPAASTNQCGNTLTNSASIGTDTDETNSANNDDTADVDVICADVGVSKAAVTTQVVPGELVTYTLAFSNGGTAAAQNFVITDTLPANVTWEDDTAGVFGFGRTVSPPNVIYTLSSLSAGGSGVITLTGRVQAATACNLTLTNQVQVASSTPDAGANSKSDSDSSVQTICADVTVLKTGPGAGTLIRPFETVTYTIVYTNQGLADAQNVTITDINPVSGATDTVLTPVAVPVGGGGTLDYAVTTDLSICSSNHNALTNTAFIGTTTPESDTGNNSSTATSATGAPQISCLPDLQVSKTDGLAPGQFVYAGQSITYTISYTNSGFADATNVVLTETLPNYTQFVGPSGWNQVGSSNQYTYAVGTLPFTPTGTNSGSVQFIVRVNTTLPVTVTTVTNTVSIGSDQTDENPGDDDDNEPTPVRSIPDLVVTKVSQTAVISPGGLATYAITITNSSDTTATNVVITDTLPANTVYSSDTLGGHSGGNPVVWNLGQLNPGQTRSFNLTIDPDINICGASYLINSVEAFGEGRRDRTPANNSDTTDAASSPAIQCLPDLQVSKTDGLAPGAFVYAGELITYTISYTNSGFADATNVVLTETLPNHTQFVGPAGWSQVGSSSQYTFLVGTLPYTPAPTNSGSVQFIVRVNTTLPVTVTTVTNTVSIGSDQTDENPGDDNTDEPTPVRSIPDLVVTKAALTAQIAPGGLATYVVTVTNSSDTVADNIVVTDTLPLGTSYNSDTLGAGAPTISSGVAVWATTQDILPGDTTTFNLTVIADGGSGGIGICDPGYPNTRLINTVTIFGTGGRDRTPANNTDTTGNDNTSPQIRCLPDLQVSKTDGLAPGAFVYAGELITYTIRYTNSGFVDATNVVLTETLPNYTQFVGPAGWSQVGSSSQYTFLVGTLAPANTGSAQFIVRVNTTLPVTVTTVTNTVSIGSDQTDENPGDDNTTEPTPVRSIPDLVVTKAALTAQIAPGGLATYAITITNSSDTTATNVVVTDTLPLGTSYNSDTLGVGAPTISSGVAVWSTGQSILPGDTTTFNLTVIADGGSSGISICDPAYTDTRLINTVEAFGEGRRDQNPADNSYTTGANDSSSPLIVCQDLAITKTLLDSAASVGKVTTFTISYQNIGSFTATNPVITDFLDTNVLYVDDTLGGAVTTTNTVVWALNDLGPGASGSFEIGLMLDVNAVVCSSGFISFTNSVSIGSDLPDADSSNNQSNGISSGNIPCGPDLVVVKNDNVGSGNVITQVVAGGLISYTISVNNIGSETATNVVLTETIPANTSLFSANPTGWSGGPSQYTFNVGSLPSGSGRVFQFVVRVDPTLDCAITQVVNRVDAGSDGPEADPSDNTSTEQTPVRCNPVQLSKDDGGLICAVPGQLIDYTITVTNTDSSPSASQLLTEFLPVNTSFQGPVGTWTGSGSGPFTRNIGVLAPGQVDTTGFWVQVDPNLSSSVTAITNVVRLSPSGLDFTLVTPINHTAPDLYVVKNDNIELLSIQTAEQISRIEQKTGQVPWLEKLKDEGLQAQALFASPGDVISYSIAYGNAGVAAAANVVITETLPDNTTFLGPLYWQQVGTSNTYVYTISNLGPGMGGNLILRVRVDDPFPTGVPGITNTLQIDSDALVECDTSDNISKEFTSIQPRPGGGGDIYLPIILKPAPTAPTPTPTATPTGPTPTPVPPTATPTPTPLAYVSDVAADPDTNQVFIASPRHDWVYVINGSSDTIARNVPVGHGPTGLTVLDAVVPANNKVFVAHQYGANLWRPGVMAFGVNDATSHPTSDGGYSGAAPIKIASNGSNGERVYVSNYFDKLAVIAGGASPPENRIGWVEQKAYQAAYGIDTSSATNRVYLASRDTGELVIFDGNADRLLQSDYIPTHVKPPQACTLWSVAVNETTGHVFVPCPQLGKVYVLQESQVTVLDLEQVATLEDRDGELALVVAAVSAPWIAEIDIPSGTGLGEEGIAADTTTGRVYITNARNNTLVILQDGGAPTYDTTVSVGTTPQGVDVNIATQKVYVGNAGSNNVTVLNGASPYGVITTIPLTP